MFINLLSGSGCGLSDSISGQIKKGIMNHNNQGVIDHVDDDNDDSSMPPTEANSREDLIEKNDDDNNNCTSDYANITNCPSKLHYMRQQQQEQQPIRSRDGAGHFRGYHRNSIAGFLSVPTIRKVDVLMRREISSSPAKSISETIGLYSNSKLRTRRLSQDSGIGTGQLYCGGGGVETNLTAVARTNKSTDNIYNDLESNFDNRFSSTINQTSDSEANMNRQEPESNATDTFNGMHTASLLATTYKSNSISILPLPAFMEDDSERSPTQAFGPKLQNRENIPGTAMAMERLIFDLETDGNAVNGDLNGGADIATKKESSCSNIMIDNNMVTNPSKNSGSPTMDKCSISGKSRKLSYEADNEKRRTSQQDLEGLDPESLMFRDGRRKIDMVLAWEEEDLGVMTEAEAKRRDKRRAFMENLIKEGLEVELEDKSQSFDEKTYFLKIHLPWRLQERLGEVLNLKHPLKRFITISVKPPWAEENVVSRNVQYWKDVWNRLTQKIQLDDSLLETEPSFKKATEGKNAEETFIVKDRASEFTSAQRSLMVMQVLVRTPFDESTRCGIRRLVNDKTYLACFPLHEGCNDRPHSSGVVFDRRILYQNWAHPSQWYKKQPLCLVRKYFGDKIALYFCWLGFYTQMLVYPAIVGTICFLYGLASIDSKDNIPSKEICNEYGTGNITLCPLCDRACSYQKLYDSCLFAKLSYLFDNPSTVFFAIFMSFWATTFLELWKRKQSVLIWEWDLMNIESDEENRPEFETNATKFRINPVTREKEAYMSSWSRAVRFAITGSAVVFMISIVLCAVLGTIIYRISLVSVVYGGGGFFVKEHAKLFTTITAALINLVVIMILTKIYHRMALRLTNLENPRTHTEYEDSYTFKIFFFEFMNFYSSLIYIAFFKGRFFDYPGDDTARNNEFFRLKNDICDPAGCLSELCIQLAIIMVGKQCWNNFMEYLFPKFYNWWRQRKHKQATKNESHLHMAWEQDYHMQDPGRLALFDEYLEMILQYGFVTLFVAAFPLAPLFALLNNVAEIRLDAYKMVTQARRPLAERVEDIGAWYGILRIITYTAVVSNAFVIAYTSDFIPRMVYKFVYSNSNSLKGYIEHSLSVFNTSDYKEEWGASSSEHDPDTCQYRGYRNGPNDYDPYGLSPHYWHVFAARLAFVVVFEHVVFVITGVMQFVIPDIPSELKTQMQREQLLSKEAKYQSGLKQAQSQDVLSLLRETGSRASGSITGGGTITARGSWARRFSRLSDGDSSLEANVEIVSRPRRSVESTVWEVS